MSNPATDRPRRRKPLVGLIVGLAVLAVLAAAGLWAWKAFENRTTEHQSDSYDDPITALTLTGNAGDVTITATDTDTIEVDKTLSYNGDAPTSDEKVSGDTLTIAEHGCGDFDLMGIERCEIAYDIKVPADVTLDITVDSGDIATDGITADQKLHADSGDLLMSEAGAAADLKTDSGGITVDGAAGPLTAEADSGNIEARNVASTDVTVTADSGDADLGFTTAPDKVKATCDSGDITITVPSGDTYRVDVTTDSGSEDIGVDNSSDADKTITAEADSGNVTITNG